MIQLRNKKILLIIAHPDDEILWFGSGLMQLCNQSDVSIICLTYDENSIRGIEIKTVAKKLNFQIYFCGVCDPGMHDILSEIEERTINILHSIEDTFDLLITHPFHSNSNKHIHHTQAFYLGLRISYIIDSKFGIFSENKISFNFFNLMIKATLDLYKINIKLNKSKGHIDSFIYFTNNQIRLIKLLLKSRKQIEYQSDPVERFQLLTIYKTQIEFMKKYNAFYQDKTYLYLFD